jgi:glycine/D-amino acid oxidase-like deaminating enzyme
MTANPPGRAALASDADAIVIGGGVVGACLAGFLAEEGWAVLVIDDGRTGGSNANAGSLHVQMQSRFMKLYPQDVPDMERQLPFYLEAIRFWRSLAAKLGADFDLKISGGLMVAETEADLKFLQRKAERERTFGLDVRILERAELDRLAPKFGPAIIGAELCADEGKLNPLLCNATLRKWAASQGVTFLDGEKVQRVEKRGQNLVVTTDRRALHSRSIALAAGASSGRLAEGLGIAIPSAPEPLHLNITEPARPLLEHLVQHAAQLITLKQLGTGQIVVGGGWPARLDDNQYPAVEFTSLSGNLSLALSILPQLASLEIIRTWGGINARVDGTGVLGPAAAEPHLFFAIPGDAGYTLGPLSARLVADTMLGQPPRINLAPYSPDRFAVARIGTRALSG